jgi:hypothetical protein
MPVIKKKNGVKPGMGLTCSLGHFSENAPEYQNI